MIAKKLNFFLSFIALSTLCIGSIKAELGNGSSGGGQGKNGQLRDLMKRENSRCEAMSETIKSLPALKDIIEKLKDADLGMHLDYLDHINKTTVCYKKRSLNGELITNQDGITKSELNWDQWAVRVDYENSITIYVDENYYNDPIVQEYTKSFLFVHEISHSHVSKKPELDYYDRIRGYVGDLSDLYSDDKITRDNLVEVSSKYHVAYPNFGKFISISLEFNLKNLRVISPQDKNSLLLKKYLPTILRQEDPDSLLQLKNLYCLMLDRNLDNEENLNLLKEKKFDMSFNDGSTELTKYGPRYVFNGNSCITHVENVDSSFNSMLHIYEKMIDIGFIRFGIEDILSEATFKYFLNDANKEYYKNNNLNALRVLQKLFAKKLISKSEVSYALDKLPLFPLGGDGRKVQLEKMYRDYFKTID